MILIGSQALNLIAPQILNREPRDFDFIATKEEAEAFIDSRISQFEKVYRQGNKLIAEGTMPCEFELLEESPTAQMFADLVSAEQSPSIPGFGQVPSLDLLFTLKSSHRYLKNSPHFWKNAMDYHKMKMVGAKVKEEYKDFLKAREKATYVYAHPKLNVSKKDFFKDDNIQYVYDHDSLHVAVKHLDRPAYTYYMVDGAEVQTSKKKFFEVDELIRLYGVLEESYVLALERSQIPHAGKLSPKNSFSIAISKVATSITSGWFREFAYENIFKVLKMYSDDYVQRFEEGLNAGVVKPFTGELYG